MADGIDRINTYVLMNHTESDLRFLGGWRVWLPPSQGYGGLWGGEDEIPMTKRQAPIHKNLVRYTSSSRWIWPICFLVALGINGCDYGKINSHVISAEANTTPVLQVRLNDQVLNIKLSNFGKTVIRVDRELVFLLDVFPVSPD